MTVEKARVVFLVPRREGVPERDATWLRLRDRWQKLHPGWPIYEGHHLEHEGPFSRSVAVNRAAVLADADGPWTHAIVIDADVFIAPDQLRLAVATSIDSGKVTWAFRRWRGMDKESSERAVADWADESLLSSWTGHGEFDMDLVVERTNPISWSCVFVVPRPTWDDMRGFDERFRGWGYEDMAFQSTVVGLYGHERIEGDVYHLWHPRTSGAGRASRDTSGLTREAVINARLGRRYMVAARRDHGQTDRLTPTDAEEMERDIANLKRDDAKYSRVARQLGLPDWDRWWPTLEGLRDGRDVPMMAIAGAPEPSARDVTVIVHTDGRREYIELAIPSLVANMAGNVTRRVIFDDSGDPEYKEWLARRFSSLGFYVVGPQQRLGYTGSMQAMWRYLARRATSEFVFQVEDDFTYRRPFDLDAMIGILEARPYLAQVALLRAAAYPLELDAGGVLEQHPERYESVAGVMEHRDHFTANPSLFRRGLCVTHPWPEGKSSERQYANRLLRDPALRFGYLGDGEPWIDHIGLIRAGSGY